MDGLYPREEEPLTVLIGAFGSSIPVFFWAYFSTTSLARSLAQSELEPMPSPMMTMTMADGS